MYYKCITDLDLYNIIDEQDLYNSYLINKISLVFNKNLLFVILLIVIYYNNL